MKDKIDIKNEKERIQRSIIKFWNVHYKSREEIEREEQEEADRKAREVFERLEAEAAADEAQKEAERMAAFQQAQYTEQVDERALYNETTGSFSGTYGQNDDVDEVTKGQIERILQEKNEAMRSLIEGTGK